MECCFQDFFQIAYFSNFYLPFSAFVWWGIHLVVLARLQLERNPISFYHFKRQSFEISWPFLISWQQYLIHWKWCQHKPSEREDCIWQVTDHIALVKSKKNTIYIYIYIYIYISCRAGSMDIPDPLSPLIPIVNRPRQVLRTASRILTQLLNVCPCWSSCFCTAMCGGP